MEKQQNENYGLTVGIDNYESMSFTDGNEGFVIYLKIQNNSSKSQKINVLKANYITKGGEQIEQDNWLNGYLSGEDVLLSNAFKKAGLIFYKPKLKGIAEKDAIYVTIELINKGCELIFCFLKNGNNWLLTDNSKNEIEIKLTPKQLASYLLRSLERLEAFEERLDVRFENISVKVDNDGWVFVLFELHSNKGTNLDNTIKIECTAYDVDSQILDVKDTYAIQDKFFGFEVFKFQFGEDGIANKINKLRLYPKKY